MFTERLKLTLTLTGSSGTAIIAAGEVDRFQVDLHAWGFEAEVGFSTWPEHGEDPALPLLTAGGVVTARLEVASSRPPAVAPDPLLVSGPVTRAAFVEQHLDDVPGRPIRRRRFTLAFADPAQVLWRQHHPCELVATAALGDIIDRQVMEGITLRRAWPRLDVESAIVCLGLPADEAGTGAPSFYDFLCWYVDVHAGRFTYDAQASTYTLAKEKPAGGTVGVLSALGVASSRTLAPPRSRHSVEVLDAQAAASSRRAVANADAVAGVRRDVLARPPTTVALDDLEAVEKGRVSAAAVMPCLEVELACVPQVSLRPGLMLKTAAAAGWAPQAWATNRTWRVHEVRVQARSDVPAEDATGTTERAYELEWRAGLEADTDLTQRVPAYVAPRYPVHAEGKIVAAGGGEAQRRWQVLEDDRAGGSVYTVDVVLWNAKVIAPFLPDQQPGQLFFPAYKHATVLLALGLHDARIVRHLDWGPTVRLPQDGQGDHMLLGFDETTETSIAHAYADEQPQLVVKRFNSGDKQTISLVEGMTTFKVMEEAGAAAAAPTADVTLQVEMARGELGGQIGGSIGELSGSFGGASSALSGAIGGATGEVQGALSGATGEVNGRIDAATAELGAMRGSFANGAAPVVSAANAAKSELMAELE